MLKMRQWVQRLALVGLIALVSSSPGILLAQGATPPPAPIYVSNPVSDSVSLERQIDPPTLRLGQDTEVELRLSGGQSPACQGIPGRPVDMLIVFDISASAGFGPGSNWERSVTWTQALLDHMDRPVYRNVSIAENSRAGLVSSQTGTLGPEPVLLQALTEDYALLRGQVTGLTPQGDTDLAAGLRMAAQELAQTPADRAQAIVLMLHDNTALNDSTQAAVGEVQAQGIPVYLVGNSLNIPPENQISADSARSLVPEARVYLDPEPDMLYELFIQATEGSDEWAAASIQVSETFDPVGWVELSDVSGPGGRAESDRVLWDLDTVEFGETVSLVYRLHLRSNAGESLNISTDMVWLGCNGYPHSTLEGAPVGLETASIEVQDRLPADLAATPAPGVVVAAPASDSDDDGGLPLWLLLLCPLLLLALLAFLWWKRRQSPTRPAARARPTVRPDRRTLPDLEDARGRRPNGDDVKHGLTSRSITDQLGRELTMRSPTPGVVQRNLQAGQNATMHVWIEDEKNNELGRATLTLEIIQQTDPLTGRTDHWRQARIDDPSAFVKMDQQSGVGMLILQELERLAQQHQAREIYGKSARPDARSFFKGYKVRRNRLGESELFKPFS